MNRTRTTRQARTSPAPATAPAAPTPADVGRCAREWVAALQATLNGLGTEVRAALNSGDERLWVHIDWDELSRILDSIHEAADRGVNLLLGYPGLDGDGERLLPDLAACVARAAGGGGAGGKGGGS